MMLKKQTVWLLTMLSLMIVLSVYYMTSPSEEQVAFVNDKEQTNQTEQMQMENNNDAIPTEQQTVETGDQIETVTSSTSTDELFASLRLDIDDQRSRRHEELANIVASNNVTPEEKNQAIDEMKVLEQQASKERILEKEIQADQSFQDVLVRADEDTIHVTVKSNELSGKQATQIMQMVRDEFGRDIIVDVKFQP